MTVFMLFKVFFTLKIANVRKCFAKDTFATLSDGSQKSLETLEVGDKVKTLDSNGKLVDTDVIMIMDKSSEKCT
jgi:hypothetical protein